MLSRCRQRRKLAGIPANNAGLTQTAVFEYKSRRFVAGAESNGLRTPRPRAVFGGGRPPDPWFHGWN
jgi:hypothetical protein